MNIAHFKLCVYSGIAFLVFFALGWAVLGGHLPPIDPAAGAEEVAQFYQADTWRLRLGLIIAAFATGFYFPWITAVSQVIKRNEGSSPLLAWTQLSSGAFGAAIIYLALFLWLAATYRPDRDALVTYAFSDLGWLLFTTTIAPFFIQFFSLGIAVLSDKRATPLLPRWIAYYTFVSATAFLPAALIFYFKQGPFAWDGVFAFWLPLIDFFIWMIVMSVFMLKSADKA